MVEEEKYEKVELSFFDRIRFYPEKAAIDLAIGQIEKAEGFDELTPGKQEEIRQAIRDFYQVHGIHGALKPEKLKELKLKFKEIRERGGG